MSDKQYTHHDDQTHLETALRRAKPWLEANAAFLIYGLAAVLAVAALIVWIQRRPTENAEVSALLLAAQSPEDFQNIADKFEGTDLGRLARLKQAEGLLNSGTRKMFTDREAASLELEQAEAALNRLSDTGDLDAAARERVLIGKARLAELRCDGTEASVQTALDAWNSILEHNEASIAKEMIERRVARLQQSGAEAFYTWFHDLDPQPLDGPNFPGLSGHAPGPGTAVPDVPTGLDLPSLSLPETDDSDSETADDDTSSDESSEASDADESGAEESGEDADAPQESPSEEPSADSPSEPSEETPETEEPASSNEPTEEASGDESVTEDPAEPEPGADAGE